MNKIELHKLAALLEDEACDLRILAEDGVKMCHKMLLARSASQLDNVALTIRLQSRAALTDEQE